MSVRYVDDKLVLGNEGESENEGEDISLCKQLSKDTRCVVMCIPVWFVFMCTEVHLLLYV